jgi:enamine deaminase RidA (YjgF/YER057c/UK114 family)
MDIDVYSRKLHACEQASFRYRAVCMMNSYGKSHDEQMRLTEVYDKFKDDFYAKARDLEAYVNEG